MNAELESTLEKKIIRFAKKHNWFVAKFVSPGLRGVPDRVFIRDGLVLFIEIKRKGEVPTEQQLRRHDEMREHGGLIFVVDDIEFAFELLK